MSDAAGRWSSIGPSALLRRWRLAACALCVAIATVLLAKAGFSAAPLPLLLAGAAHAAAAAWIAFEVRPRGRGPNAVRIDGDGLIWLRVTRNGAEVEFAVQGPTFVSSQLLVLSAPGWTVGLWRDAVADDAFRRIAVACRWPRQLPPEQAGQTSGAGIR